MGAVSNKLLERWGGRSLMVLPHMLPLTMCEPSRYAALGTKRWNNAVIVDWMSSMLNQRWKDVVSTLCAQ